MIHDGTQDQDLYNEQEGLSADAEALPGRPERSSRRLRRVMDGSRKR
jgi:hypothetical protein